MKLYHGTDARFLQRILKQGLLPRGKRASNWPDATSHPGCVYLTDAYAPYFCWSAQQRGLVVEIETDRLDQRKLLPDEDVIEQTGRGKDGVEGDYLERTAFFKKQLHLYTAGQWKQSLKAMGTCAYLGKIPVAAITRTVVFSTDYCWQWDAMISLINYRLLGDRYRAQTARLFGDVPAETPQGINAQTWQFPMKGHTLSVYNDVGACVETRHITAPDERRRWQELLQAGEAGGLIPTSAHEG